MFRRNLSIVLPLLLVASMLLAACGPSATPTPAPAQPPAAAAPTAVPPTEAPAAAEPTAVPPTEAPAAAEATAAPASGECKAGAPTLTIWADENRVKALLSIKDQVQAETGICLVLQTMTFADIRSNVSLQAPAGEGPDIFFGAHDWLGELTANGVVAEMDLGAKAPDFDPVSVKAFTWDGKLYGLPYAVENIAFLCNPDVTDTAPATFDEIETMSKEAKDAGKVTQFYALQTGDAYHNEPGLTAFGGYIFGLTDTGDYDACDVGLDNEGTVAYLTWLQKMTKAGLLDPNVDGATAETLFKEDKAACMVTGPWNVKPFADAGATFEFYPFPSAAQDGSPFVGVQGAMINAFSPNKVLAQSFLVDYIATQEMMEQFYLLDNRPPAYLPAQAAMDEVGKAFAAGAAAGHPMPGIPAMASVWSALEAAYKTVMLGSATPEEAAKTAAEQVRAAAGECP